MLVLSRERDEEIVLDFTGLTDADLALLRGGKLVVVTVVDIRGDKVRTGLDAPRSVEIHRREVYADIQRERRAEEAAKPKEASGS